MGDSGRPALRWWPSLLARFDDQAACILTDSPGLGVRATNLASPRGSRTLPTMRPAVTLIYVLASLSLLAAPYRSLHAHIDSDHDRVVVHDGHTHDFDNELADHVGHLADVHDDDVHDHEVHGDHEFDADQGDHDANHEALDHSFRFANDADCPQSDIVVDASQRLYAATIAGKLRHTDQSSASLLALLMTRIEDPPDRSLRLTQNVVPLHRPSRDRSCLHPPLRGPPAIIL